MKYIYWFKQQTVSLVFLTICGLISYTLTLKSGWGTTELVLTADCAIKILAVALSHIFVVPFFFKWWDLMNEQ
jgi:hypothetical protein